MRTFIRADLAVGFFVAITALCGCGGNPATKCDEVTVISVNPTSATVNHAATPPANQVQFVANAQPYSDQPGCAVPDWIAIVYGTWSNPDPTDIQISSALDNTNGTAVCKSATNGAVTLTGTFSELVPAPVTKTVQLTCN
jgi:hypothetical protein